MKRDVDSQADALVSKIKHYLITMMGRSADEAHSDEFYRALCFSLREEIMINWSAAAKTHREKDVRMVYYLSMEYLPTGIIALQLKIRRRLLCGPEAQGNNRELHMFFVYSIANDRIVKGEG